MVIKQRDISKNVLNSQFNYFFEKNWVLIPGDWFVCLNFFDRNYFCFLIFFLLIE